jgi:hypothetical protein
MDSARPLPRHLRSMESYPNALARKRPGKSRTCVGNDAGNQDAGTARISPRAGRAIALPPLRQLCVCCTLYARELLTPSECWSSTSRPRSRKSSNVPKRILLRIAQRSSYSRRPRESAPRRTGAIRSPLRPGGHIYRFKSKLLNERLDLCLTY